MGAVSVAGAAWTGCRAARGETAGGVKHVQQAKSAPVRGNYEVTTRL